MPEEAELQGTEGMGEDQDAAAAAAGTEGSGEDQDDADAAEASNLKEDLSDIVKGLARIKISSSISDAAMDKMLRFMYKNHRKIDRLIDHGMIGDSYSRSIRPKALEETPKVICTYVTETFENGEYVKRVVTNLALIPAWILRLPNNGPIRLLRTESHVTLQSIKEHHLKVHLRMGFDREELMEQFKRLQLSYDGVEESEKGSRNFQIVTVRIGSCIYLVSISNPLIGVKSSKPSMEDILRYIYYIDKTRIPLLRT